MYPMREKNSNDSISIKINSDSYFYGNQPGSIASFVAWALQEAMKFEIYSSGYRVMTFIDRRGLHERLINRHQQMTRPLTETIARAR